MNLDEAIDHARTTSNFCDNEECSEEHRQLWIWLKELKKHREESDKPKPTPKTLDELFPYEYKGGGYFRKRGVEVGESAPILHAHQAIEYLFEKMIDSNS